LFYHCRPKLINNIYEVRVTFPKSHFENVNEKIPCA